MSFLIDAAQAEIGTIQYTYRGLKITIIAKTAYGVSVLEETGRHYIISPITKIYTDRLVNPIISEAPNMPEESNVRPSRELSRELNKLIDNELCTAPSIGISVPDIIEMIKKELSEKFPELNTLNPTVLRDAIYVRKHALKAKGYIDICNESRRFALRTSEATPKDTTLVDTGVKQIKEKLDSISIRTIKAIDANFGEVYYSPKGIPCRPVEKSKEGVHMVSLITDLVTVVPNNFELLPEAELNFLNIHKHSS